MRSKNRILGALLYTFALTTISETARAHNFFELLGWSS